MRPGKKQIAYHEAGHAVVARVLGVDVTQVHRAPGNSFAGTWSATWLATDAEVPIRIAAMETEAKVALAGQLAQLRYRPLTGPKIKQARESYWADDQKNVGNYAGMAVMLKHGQEPIPGTELDASYSAEALALVNRLLAETMTLVEQNWSAIERVADALLNRGTLTQDELDALIADRPPTSAESGLSPGVTSELIERQT